jgi:hypothetical protein
MAHPYQFDGLLTRSDATLVFTQPLFSWSDLTMRLTLVRESVSGSLVSNQSYANDPSYVPSNRDVLISSAPTPFYTGHATPVDVSGVVQTDREEVTGAFDGYVDAEHVYAGWFKCTGHFTWSLAPR